MKKWIILIIAIAFLNACKKDDSNVPLPEKPTNIVIQQTANNPIVTEPDSVLIKLHSKWLGSTHGSMTAICATQWGLDSTRINNISQASLMPDVYDVQGPIPYANFWYHGWAQIINGIWAFGHADMACKNNIDGCGLNCKSSYYYFSNGNSYYGDWYLGYASHYMEDCGNPWHTSLDIIQFTHHFNYEKWVESNWTSGYNFSATVYNDYYYYVVTDPAKSTRTLAIYSNSKNSTLYNAYINSGFPTNAGTGNQVLINETRNLLKQTARYIKGLIKYTLDENNAWNVFYTP